MKINSRSIFSRLLLPILGVIVLIVAALLLLISRISNDILDEYMHQTLVQHENDARRLLETAVVELATARLLENRAVVEIKQRTVLEALPLRWSAKGIDGIVIGPDQAVLLTTLPKDLTARILALPPKELFSVDNHLGKLHGERMKFLPWRWDIVMVTHALAAQPSRREVLLLLPLVAAGSLAIIVFLFFIFRRNLQQPIDLMVRAISAGGEVPGTGIAEFDHIGAAVNEGMAKVRSREKEIHLLLDSTAEGIYGVDRHGSCTFCNAACLRMLGYDRADEVLGKNTHALFHYAHADGREYAEAECRIYQAYQRQEGVHADTEVFWRKDNSSFPVEYWSYPVIENGQVFGAVVTFIDISERQRADADLREEKNKFEAIIAALGEGLSIQDREFRVLYQNDVHRQIVGPHVGEHCHRAYQGKDDVCPGCPVAASYSDGLVHMVERTRETPAGMKYFEIAASPLRNAAGEIVAGIELVRDVTERKRTEQQLQQSQKMEAIGQLAGGVAHDFNNILTAITGYASFLKLKTEEGSQLRHYGVQILTAAEKAGKLTRQILAFSRKQVIKPQLMSINESIRGMEKMMFRLLGEDIEVRIALTDEDATVLADPGQIEQVLLNLATNARDAMPAGGNLHISTEIALLDEAACRNKGLKKPGRYVVTSFSDTGEGMSENVRQRIFEPFFTTKEMGRGTGLGLSIVYGIVTQHEGAINVYSEPGEGTSFRMYLPLAAQQPKQAVPPEQNASAGKGEVILLAEDDATVREIARLTLAEAGYQVIVAVDGSDAVARFREQQDAVQLCLFDLIMPKKNGKAALEEIRAIRPGIRALFMSGYAADIIRSKDLVTDDVEVLDKPLVPEELLRRVRKAVDAAAPGTKR